MEDKLKKILEEYSKKARKASNLNQIDQMYLDLFAKSGYISLASESFPNLSSREMSKVGPIFNQTKTQLEREIEQARTRVQEQIYKSLEKESFDPTGGKIQKRIGHLHPVTEFEEEIVKLFGKIGFVQADAPQIDTDYNNFEVLNIPENHPARDLWDTLYIDTTSHKLPTTKLLLRTHTSNSQIRILKNNQLPIRMMTLGRCFRYENVDARHEHTFEQFEIVYVDKGVSMANLQYLSEYFFKAVLGKDIKARLRPKYYPFVEPGVGIEATCVFCKGKGCRICGGSGWMELAGAGMIHPSVLKAGGIDPNEYSGIAWGVGPERMVMLREGIEDLRLFKNGDLKLYESK